MATKIYFNNENVTGVKYLTVDDDAAILKDEQRLAILKNLDIQWAGEYGDIAISCRHTVPDIAIRSLRALIFGTEYKCVRRISGDFTDFRVQHFNFQNYSVAPNGVAPVAAIKKPVGAGTRSRKVIKVKK